MLWVSVGQGAAELPAVKVEGKKDSAARPGVAEAGSNWAEHQNFFLPPTLTASTSAAL